MKRTIRSATASRSARDGPDGVQPDAMSSYPLALAAIEVSNGP